MVNKHVLRETFMKLESYDRVNVISDILRLSSSFELEFYSSVIENILQYHKLSSDNLREELNHENNLKCFLDSDCTDSNVRSKLISTLSLLKASNVNGASKIFAFIRQNHVKFKKQAHDNPIVHEEVLLIYQLANYHPAFSFDHCQEIFEYLRQIRLISVSTDYFNANNNDECIYDLNVMSVYKNEKQQYVYRIKVKWDHFECCIIRTLEDVYLFYQKLYELFSSEIKHGEVCHFYLSFIPENLELSRNLMSTFFRDFLNSPQSILRCDFVRQFFKPRTSDKCICDCDPCRDNFNKLHWTGDRKFDLVTKYSSLNDPSDNEDSSQSYDNKTETSISSDFNSSINSQCYSNNLQPEPPIENRTCSEDDIESSVKYKKKNTKIYFSTGSSPINTPSDESEVGSKNEDLRSQNNGINCPISIVSDNVNIPTTSKEITTENWLCQSNESKNDHKASKKELLDNKGHNEHVSCNGYSVLDVSRIAQCKIGNLQDWLKHIRLHKYYYNLYSMNFGTFHSLTEEVLNEMGLVEGASKKLVSLIRKIQPSDIISVNRDTVNIIIRERSNSIDSGTSNREWPMPIKTESQFPETINRAHAALIHTYSYPILMPNNIFLIPSNLFQNITMISPEKAEQIHQVNNPCGLQR